MLKDGAASISLHKTPKLKINHEEASSPYRLQHLQVLWQDSLLGDVFVSEEKLCSKEKTKEESCWALFRAEMYYLHNRGWQNLVGGKDPKYWVAPDVDYKLPETLHYTQDEALAIQKQKDNYNQTL